MPHLKKYSLFYAMILLGCVVFTCTSGPIQLPPKQQTYKQLIQKLYPFATPVIASSVSLVAYVWDIRVNKTQPRTTDLIVLSLTIAGLDRGLRYAIDHVTSTENVQDYKKSIA
jgi:hypothetical protein